MKAQSMMRGAARDSIPVRPPPDGPREGADWKPFAVSPLPLPPVHREPPPEKTWKENVTLCSAFARPATLDYPPCDCGGQIGGGADAETTFHAYPTWRNEDRKDRWPKIWKIHGNPLEKSIYRKKRKNLKNISRKKIELPGDEAIEREK